MDLADYFENTEGTGVLGTADADGMVDLAIYARPHVIDEHTVAFIMADRLSHDNITANPHAAYLFVEKTQGYHGLRLYLTKTTEETDPQKIEAIRRKCRKDAQEAGGQKFLVQFNIDKTRRLVGD
jgi:hypothetical protein